MTVWLISRHYYPTSSLAGVFPVHLLVCYFVIVMTWTFVSVPVSLLVLYIVHESKSHIEEFYPIVIQLSKRGFGYP